MGSRTQRARAPRHLADVGGPLLLAPQRSLQPVPPFGDNPASTMAVLAATVRRRKRQRRLPARVARGYTRPLHFLARVAGTRVGPWPASRRPPARITWGYT